MIKPRRRPKHTRVIRSAYGDQVPLIVEAYVDSIRTSAYEKFSEHEVDGRLRALDENLTIYHLPTREEFEHAFVRRQAFPAEVKSDPVTDRLYLVGAGLPGREELKPTRRAVRDKKTNARLGDEIVTESEIKDDLVISYTEVSWTEHRNAIERAKKLPLHIRQGLTSFFQLPPEKVSAALLALASLTNDDIDRIAQYANDPRTG